MNRKRIFALLFTLLWTFTVLKPAYAVPPNTSAPGTNNASWQINGGNGPIINDNGGILEARNPANSAYIIFRSNSPLAANDVATKAYVDSLAVSGDVTGPVSATVVSKINGATAPPAGALTTGNVLRVTGASTLAYGPVDLTNSNAVTGALPNANQAAQTLAGDVTGNTGASVVSGIKGNAVPTLSTGFLQWTGSAFSWGVPGGGFAAGGDLAGSSSSQAVVGIQGRAVTSSAPTTGNGYYWNGTTWAPSALNLAGGSAFVTGTLPAANQGAQTVGGDASGTTSSITNTGLKANALPALSSGYLQWTGSAWAFTTPSGTVTPPTGSGFWHETAGALDGTASHGTTGQIAVSTGSDTPFVTMSGDATIVSGGALTLNTVTVGKGGTGAATFTAHALLLGEGTSAFTPLLLNDAQIVVGQTSANPSAKTLSGDATLADTGALTNTGLKGNAIPSLASGYLQWTGTAFAWTTPGAAVTGTGVWHSTSSALDGAALIGTADQLFGTNHGGTDTTFFTLTGDASIASGSLTVKGLQTRAVAATAPTTGNTLEWNGSTWTPAAVNLAGGSNFVTGTLPAGNLPSLAGDVTGTLTANTVTAISGGSPFNITPATLQWLTGTASPVLKQVAAGSATNGHSMLIQAQNGGTGSTSGGNLVLQSGTGGSSVLEGAVTLETGSGNDDVSVGHNLISLNSVAGNYTFGSGFTATSGVGIIGVANAGTVPTTPPTGGGAIYAVSNNLFLYGGSTGSGGGIGLRSGDNNTTITIGATGTPGIALGTNGSIALNTSGNLTFGATGGSPPVDGGVGVFGLQNATTIPTGFAGSNGIEFYSHNISGGGNFAFEINAAAFTFNSHQNEPFISQATATTNTAGANLFISAQSGGTGGSPENGGDLILNPGSGASGGSNGRAFLETADLTTGVLEASANGAFMKTGGTTSAPALEFAAINGLGVIAFGADTSGTQYVQNYANYKVDSTLNTQKGVEQKFFHNATLISTGGYTITNVPLPTAGSSVTITLLAQARVTSPGSSTVVGDVYTAEWMATFSNVGGTVSRVGNWVLVFVEAAASLSGSGTTVINAISGTNIQPEFAVFATTGTLGQADASMWMTADYN